MSPDRAVNDRFEVLISSIETRLVALEAALGDGDGSLLEQHCAGLHTALAASLQGRRADEAPLSPALRVRLVAARGRIAGQRESISRAIGAAARAADVLMPRLDTYDLRGAARPGLRIAQA